VSEQYKNSNFSVGGALTHQMYRAKLYTKNRISLYIKEFQISKNILAQYI